jgi:uncharacterized protein (DUF1499 family)
VRFIIATVLVMPLFSCAGTKPANLGVKDARLAACPSSPNCVSSGDADAAHSILAFQLAEPVPEAWRGVRAAVAELPRTKIITDSDEYLHAECRSAVFGFVDDLELHLKLADKLIAVRSASRLGYSDLGVNRRRVENLRSLLREQGVVR